MLDMSYGICYDGIKVKGVPKTPTKILNNPIIKIMGEKLEELTMCKNHSVIKGIEESMEVLVQAHADHTYDCCPQVEEIEYVERNEAIKSLVGVHPVYGSPMVACNEVKDTLCALLYRDDLAMEMDWETASGLRAVLNHLKPDHWSTNAIPTDAWEFLQRKLQSQKETFERGKYAEQPRYVEFTLIKRSSPKISNLISSILKFYGKDPQNDDLMKKYNARQASKMPEFDLVISYEPHRVVGMSAFGKNWTSCQDWILKDEDHDYHSYTHMAWANMLDETCGVAYIRKQEDEEPTEQDTNVQDMLARSLVRAITLSNGHVVVYLHRIYAASPFDQVLRETFNKWEKTLPENYHVIKMYDHGTSHYDVGKNKAGIEYRGMMTKTVGHSLYVNCGINQECNECDGQGRHSCPCCDGDGKVYITLSGYDRYDNYYEEEMELECRHCDGSGDIECNECNGTGRYDREERKLPYNDHSDWIDFGSNGAKFRIPKYIVQMEVAPVHTCAEPVVQTENKDTYDNWMNVGVGDTVYIRTDIHIGTYYSDLNEDVHNSVVGEMLQYAGQRAVVTSRISRGHYRLSIDGGHCGWTSCMLTLNEIPQTQQQIMEVSA